MNNRLIRKRPNRFLYGRNNYFQDGGGITDLEYSNLLASFIDQQYNNMVDGSVINRLPIPIPSKEDLYDAKVLGAKPITNNTQSNPYIKGISGAIGKITGDLIGGELQSGVGNTISGLSGIVSAIPGVGKIGALVPGVVGGLTNRMFGSKMNDSNIAKVEQNINQLNSFQSGASDYDTLTSNYLSAPVGMTFNNSYIGKDGWFSNKAKNKANDLRQQINTGNTWVQNSLANNALNIQNQQMTNLLSNYAAYGGQLYGKGGIIHIKPSKRGTFTAAATKHGMGVQEFASRVLANKDNYSPAMVKKANFARNASKWHAEGGPLISNGGIFDTGINYVGNGGIHEENPYEGVPMGIDEEGTPNLVEEGEVIWNDYVFSNRLKVPKKVRKKYKLGGNKNLTFADAALKLSKESEERPNDPISQRGLDNSMNMLIQEQEIIRQQTDTNKFAEGGSTEVPDEINEKLLGSTAMSRYDFPKDRLAADMKYYQQGLVPVKQPNSNINTSLRYTPIYANGVLSLTDALGLTNQPNYYEASQLQNAAINAANYTPTRYTPIGNYLTYKPFDINYGINNLNSALGLQRRYILNNMSGNRASAAANLLASDNQYLGQIGDLYQKAEEYNQEQRQKVEEFNRATNSANAEGAMRAAAANAEAMSKAQSLYLSGLEKAAEIRQAERAQSAAARSANLSNFINSIADVGRENFARNMIVTDPSKYYTINGDGSISYKPQFYSLSEQEQQQVSQDAARRSQKANGGYLTIKRRRK